jgi:hypothetical protein
MPATKTMVPLVNPAPLLAPTKKMVPGPTIRPNEGKIWPRGTGK